jgi:pyruvate/2-oxoglutarate dehydrogenase complex dihydrolipoamide acyltransferase (E2) component
VTLAAQQGPFVSERMTSLETYMYGLKQRAHQHHDLVFGTFPVELTRLTTLRRRYSKEVRPVTLLPLFLKAIALSVQQNPAANRILFKRFPFGLRIVRFKGVDVNLPITRKLGDETVTFIGTLRDVDRMTVAQIQDELARLQKGPATDSPYIQKIIKLKKAPPFVARVFHWLMTRSPAFYLKNAGTCSLTVLEGMRGDYFFSSGPTTSLFCLGGIGDEPVVRDGQVVVRRIAKVALGLDNYVISGLEGLKLARTFQELCEAGSFVEEELTRATTRAPTGAASTGGVAA